MKQQVPQDHQQQKHKVETTAINKQSFQEVTFLHEEGDNLFCRPFTLALFYLKSVHSFKYTKEFINTRLVATNEILKK